MAEPGSFVGSVRRLFRDYVAAMSTRGPFGDLVTRAVNDAALRKRLLESPQQVLAEAGVKLPAGVNLEVLENSDTVIHLVLPPLVGGGEGEGAGR